MKHDSNLKYISEAKLSITFQGQIQDFIVGNLFDIGGGGGGHKGLKSKPLSFMVRDIHNT